MALTYSRTTGAETALFALGFRPFFLGAGVAALLLLAIWVYAYASGAALANYYGSGMAWHGHEMIFGYTVAVLAGFLLAAVRNWTSRDTPTGLPLALLGALWLCGRVVPFLGGWLPAWSIAAVDLAFLPALIIALLPALRGSGQAHNQRLLVILALLAGANLLVHAQQLGWTRSTAQVGMVFAVQLIVLMITVIAGRVVPFFTERAINAAHAPQWPWLERLTIGLTALLALLIPLLTGSVWVALLSLAAAAAHGARLSAWYDRRMWSIPILWILHVGYVWLVIGFVLTGLTYWGIGTPLLALHAFTAGAIGTLTLGMMARVALGHTGRPIRPSSTMVVAFVLISIAAAVRVGLPLLLPAWYITSVVGAGVVWSAAFALFAWVYAPMLMRPRVDGQPG